MATRLFQLKVQFLTFLDVFNAFFTSLLFFHYSYSCEQIATVPQMLAVANIQTVIPFQLTMALKETIQMNKFSRHHRHTITILEPMILYPIVYII